MIHDFDSFDGYQTAGLPQKYARVAASASIVPGIGRCGSQCLRTASAPDEEGVIKGFPVSGPTFQFGMAIMPGSSVTNLFSLWYGTLKIVEVQLGAGGSVTWLTNPTASFPDIAFVSNGGLINRHEWTNITFAGTFSQSGSGSLTIKKNGIVFQTASFANLGSFAPALAYNAIGLGPHGFSSECFFDDFFAGDLTGTYNNTQLGDVHVQKMILQADGSLIQWTPYGGSSPNYALVEDGASPDTTKGIQSATTGATDVYVIEDLANVAGTEIFGVKVSCLAQKDYIGDRAISPVVYAGGSAHDSGLNKPISQSSWTYTESVMEFNPATSAQFQLSEFTGGAMQIGPKLSI